MVKNLPANAGDIRHVGLIPGWGRSSGDGPGNPLQYACLENPMDRGALWVTVHRLTKSRTQVKQLSTYKPRKKWQPAPVCLPGESHGQRSLMGYGPWGCKESDMTEAT